MLKDWEKLPKYMKTEEVRPYYERLKRKRISLVLKRVFDIIVSFVMLVIFSPIMIAVSIAIVIDSKGGVFFRQERVTQYGRKFHIHKFRTMVPNAENIGSQVTVKNDMRVTRIGHKLRKYRLDELPQLIDIFLGDMTFVGTRPETPYFVKKYSPEMFATLLLPAGLTSEASIRYKDEQKLLDNPNNIDDTYIYKILPKKMYYNLKSLYKFSFISDFFIMIKTVFVVLKRDDHRRV